MKIFIMAQGKGSRWDHNIPNVANYKQLLQINDKETIIQRTIRQFARYNPTVVANEDFAPFVPILQSLHEPTGTINEGILSLNKHWNNVGYTTILLGDVVFSNDAVNTIINCNYDFTIFCRLGANTLTGKSAREIFGLKFNHLKISWMIRLLMTLKDEQAPKLWNMYEKLVGLLPSPIEIIDDYTDDVDSIEEYNARFSKLKKLVKEDDEKL
jgi:hypothetical protein